MVSGMSGINSIYSYQSSLNQMKLAQLMRKDIQEDDSASRELSKSRKSSQLQDSLTYVSDYSSAMTDLMSSANSLRSGNMGGAANQLDVTSTDTSVLSAEKNYKLKSPASYDINVTQLAAAQTNVTDAVKSSGTASDINMEISSDKGSVNISVSASARNGMPRSNNQVLSDTAKSINDASIGVKATVVTKDGLSSLQLSSDKTGESSKFEVTGDYAEKSGLTNVKQQAQNAEYTVAKDGEAASYSSESNKVTMELGKIGMEFKNTGSSTVSVGTDVNKLVTAMEDFVSSYNQAVKLVSQNIDRGKANERQLSKLHRTLGSPQEQELLGLTTANDGTLSLDKGKLTGSLREQPDLAKDGMNGPFGLAQRAFNSAQTGLSSSVESLIKNDMKEAEQSHLANPINAFNSFSRSGAYNMMNYYTAGTLFSIYA